MTEPAQPGWTGRLAALVLVFLGGFVVMVLEVYGAYLMRPYFGSSQEVWLAMIGMVMVALSAGYYLGGRIADRFRRASFLTWLLYPAGVFIFFTKEISTPVLELQWMETANVVLASTAVSTAASTSAASTAAPASPLERRTLCKIEQKLLVRASRTTRIQGPIY